MESQVFGIGCDWGTSTLRTYLLNSEGKILEKRELPRGIMTIKNNAFEKEFEKVVGNWMNQFPLSPVVMSGMIGSRQGWIEAPYIICPADIQTLFKELIPIPLKRKRNIWLAPGLACLDEKGTPDVMRGEEVQILGASSKIKSDQITICLPGSHSKWANISSGQVKDFVTYMTGELYETIKTNTILSKMITPGSWNDGAFLCGLRHSRRPNNILNHLFHVRTKALFNELSDEKSGAFLSGLLIGHELKTAPLTSEYPKIYLIGSGTLTKLYAIALDDFGFKRDILSPDIVTAGYMEILKKLKDTRCQ